MNYENVVVKKPWGYEYLLYQNDNVGIWYLYLLPGAKTSLHSHQFKKTGLVILSGKAKVSFLNGHHILEASDKIMIRNGVFHSTEALPPCGIEMLEIETPNNKEDLIRLEDYYGRAGEPYEGAEHFTEDYNRISLGFQTDIGECVVDKVWLKEKNDVYLLSDSKIMILEGMVYFKEYPVCGPGDLIDNVALAKLVNKFEMSPIHALEIKLASKNIQTNL